MNRAHLGAGRELPASLGEYPQRAALLVGKPRLRLVVRIVIVRHGVDPAAVVRGDVVLEDGPGGDGTSRRCTLLRRRAIVAVVGEAGDAAAHVVDPRRVEVMMR